MKDIVIDRNGHERELAAGELLRDGERIRVPFSLMDSGTVVLDVFGRPAGHAPGYVRLSTADIAAREQRQSEYEGQLSDAWRTAGTEPPSADATKAVADAYGERDDFLRNAWRGAR